jgi:hypothetical protein
MLKKTAALILGTLLTSSCAWAQMLIHLNLATASSSQQRSIDVEDNQNQEVRCQFDNLLLEIKATRQDNNVNMSIKLLAHEDERKLIANPEFTTELGKAVNLALEIDGQPAELTIVAVDIV